MPGLIPAVTAATDVAVGDEILPQDSRLVGIVHLPVRVVADDARLRRGAVPWLAADVRVLWRLYIWRHAHLPRVLGKGRMMLVSGGVPSHGLPLMCVSSGGSTFGGMPIFHESSAKAASGREPLKSSRRWGSPSMYSTRLEYFRP
ncbi:hypothetical protein L249_5685 [Ophiocordyceps polyrhachis-furcata BCC 54312]|uniref:Uncharacterized protein n=1 Tax=Ophiocordyceps polyrhachis-furcata BCC 54312 TaxID=1330021 RepID=A0A367L067_9HYPO|nr:hypothetical protein L249_5685 [Ophiocordyceps polyrhachis-furcata BCC 54312]